MSGAWPPLSAKRRCASSLAGWGDTFPGPMMTTGSPSPSRLANPKAVNKRRMRVATGRHQHNACAAVKLGLHLLCGCNQVVQRHGHKNSPRRAFAPKSNLWTWTRYFSPSTRTTSSSSKRCSMRLPRRTPASRGCWTCKRLGSQTASARQKGRRHPFERAKSSSRPTWGMRAITSHSARFLGV